jgi:hypothetical protein
MPKSEKTIDEWFRKQDQELEEIKESLEYFREKIAQYGKDEEKYLRTIYALRLQNRILRKAPIALLALLAFFSYIIITTR